MGDKAVVLLPCPHCGSGVFEGPHLREYVGDNYAPSWWVECAECPCGMEVDGADVGLLVGAWNTRVDRDDAEAYRSLMSSLARPDKMRSDVAPVWDSRNVGQ